MTYSSSPELAGRGEESGGTSVIAEDPLDVLPEYLQAPLRGGAAGAFLETARKWARETVVAHRLDAGRVRVLRAERQAESQRSLSRSPWVITNLDAPVTSSRRIAAAPASQSVVARRPQPPPAESPRTYW
jgi:hypothetical protein